MYKFFYHFKALILNVLLSGGVSGTCIFGKKYRTLHPEFSIVS